MKLWLKKWNIYLHFERRAAKCSGMKDHSDNGAVNLAKWNAGKSELADLLRHAAVEEPDLTRCGVILLLLQGRAIESPGGDYFVVKRTESIGGRRRRIAFARSSFSFGGNKSNASSSASVFRSSINCTVRLRLSTLTR
jgi:hypothetical protein